MKPIKQEVKLVHNPEPYPFQDSLTKQPTLVLNARSFCFSLVSAGISGICRHAPRDLQYVWLFAEMVSSADDYFSLYPRIISDEQGQFWEGYTALHASCSETRPVQYVNCSELKGTLAHSVFSESLENDKGKENGVSKLSLLLRVRA